MCLKVLVVTGSVECYLKSCMLLVPFHLREVGYQALGYILLLHQIHNQKRMGSTAATKANIVP